MLRDHKEQIEEVIELGNDWKLERDKPESDHSYMMKILENLSKDTLDYIQALYYIGIELYSETESDEEVSRKEVFEEHMTQVKLIQDDKKNQLSYLSSKKDLSKYLGIAISYIGWDIENN